MLTMDIYDRKYEFKTYNKTINNLLKYLKSVNIKYKIKLFNTKSLYKLFIINCKIR